MDDNEEFNEYEDINPFAAPPLVEYENCLTIDELQATIEAFEYDANQVKWYELVKKLKIKYTLETLYGIEDFIFNFKRKKYGIDQIN